MGGWASRALRRLSLRRPTPPPPPHTPLPPQPNPGIARVHGQYYVVFDNSESIGVLGDEHFEFRGAANQARGAHPWGGVAWGGWVGERMGGLGRRHAGCSTERRAPRWRDPAALRPCSPLPPLSAAQLVGELVGDSQFEGIAYIPQNNTFLLLLEARRRSCRRRCCCRCRCRRCRWAAAAAWLLVVLAGVWEGVSLATAPDAAGGARRPRRRRRQR